MLETFSNLIEWMYEVSAMGLVGVSIAGVTGGLLAIVVLSINAIGRRWLTASQMSLLWGLVLLRMLIPFAPECPLSVQNAAAYVESWLTSPEMSDNASYSDSDAYTTTQWTPATQPADTTAVVPLPEHTAESFPLEQLLVWLPFAWAAGVLFVLANTLIRHAIFCRRVAEVKQCEDPRLLDLCRLAASALGMKRLPRLVLFDGVSQPAVMGLFRPRLLLPTEMAELDDRQLQMVLLHELTHLKRFDTAKSWGLLLVRAVQWWNPMFWLASMRYLNLREQACDVAVVRHLTNKDDDRSGTARDYSNLLLTLASRVERHDWRVIVPASLLGFTSGRFQKRAVANRLQAIRRGHSTQGRLHILVIIVMTGAVAIAGLTDAMTPPPVEAVPPAWPGSLAMNFNFNNMPVPRPNNDEWTEERYDITRVVERIGSIDQLTSEEAAESCFRVIHNVAACSVDRLKSVSPTRTWTRPVSDTGEPSLSKDLESAEPARTATLTIAPDGENWQLELFAPQSTHNIIQRVIQAWAHSGLRQICIETRILQAERDMVEVAGLNWDSLLRAATISPNMTVAPKGSLGRADGGSFSASATASVEEQIPVLVSQLTADESRQFVQAAQSDPRGNLYFSPKVTTFNGCHATIASAVQRPFVTAVEFDDNGVHQPQVDVIEDGLRIELDPVSNAEGTAIDLISEMTFRDITDVETVTTKLRNQEVTVQLPRVRECRIDVSATVPDGESLLVGLPPAYDRKEYTYVLLTPKVLIVNGD